MSKSQTLRALVSERLAAAAQDAFVLFERTIAEYEEELSRFKDESQRKQQLVKGILRTPASPGPGLNLDTSDSLQIKEEPQESEERSVKLEEEELLPVAESCTKGRVLRALVSERLAAAAEDIFVLFERTITEYEEELSRSKEETQRKQQLLDSALSLRTDLVCGRVQISPQMSSQSAEIKEEPEEEEEQRPTFVPESSAVRVKTEDSSLLQRREETKLHFHTVIVGHNEQSPDTDHDNDCGPSFNTPPAHTPTEADGDPCRDWVKDRRAGLYPRGSSTPETAVFMRHMSGAEGGPDEKKHLCPFCNKAFGTRPILQRHIKVHTGERPYVCSVCSKTFTQKCNLDSHRRTHTGEKPYSCSVCEKTFAHRSVLSLHERSHTGVKPHSCSVCDKQFADHSSFIRHKRTHTEEKPFECLTCRKTFAHKYNLDLHTRIHTGEKPYSCTVCEKAFSRQNSLKRHMSTHSASSEFK